jgi:hypothetical protein
MRHLWSLLAGLAVAPLTWVLLALGQNGSARAVNGWEERAVYDTAELLAPAGYLVVAAAMLGLLATLRVSPVGPLAAGVLLISGYGLMFVDPFAVHDALPRDWTLFGDPVALAVPLDNGSLGLLGVLLLMATLSVQRWRRWPTAGAAYAPGADPLLAPAEPTAGEPELWRGPSHGPEPSGRHRQPDEPAHPEPAHPEPAPAASAASEPMTPEPVTPEPGAEEARTEEARTEEARTEEARTEEAGAADPAAVEPGTPPAAAEQAAAEQAAAEEPRRPAPRPRRPPSGRPRAVPAESPWVAPPRTAGREGAPD